MTLGREISPNEKRVEGAVRACLLVDIPTRAKESVAEPSESI